MTLSLLATIGVEKAMSEFLQRFGWGRRPASQDDIPPELARALEQSADDLRHDRTEDVREFIEKSRAKIAAAKQRDRRRSLPQG